MSNSSFSTEKQANYIESKIVFALERISEAYRVFFTEEGNKHSLSTIQTKIVLFLLFHSEDKCNVSYLSSEFNVTKSTISDSVRVLINKNIVKKNKNKNDARSSLLILTNAGKEIASKISEFTTKLESPISALKAENKSILYDSLLKIISILNQEGVVSTKRMCFTCHFYSKEKTQHFCNLIQSELTSSDIRMDCPEHKPL